MIIYIRLRDYSCSNNHKCSLCFRNNTGNNGDGKCLVQLVTDNDADYAIRWVLENCNRRDNVSKNQYYVTYENINIIEEAISKDNVIASIISGEHPEKFLECLSDILESSKRLKESVTFTLSLVATWTT